MERTFNLPGRQWADEVSRFSEELFNSFESGAPYPIRRIFEILPVNVLDNSNADALIKRGAFVPDLKASTLSNKGEYVEALFGDLNLGRVNIIFPEAVSAHVKRVGHAKRHYILDFSGTPIPVALYDMPAEYEIGTDQRLYEVEVTPALFSYVLKAPGDTQNTIRLNVDLTTDQPGHGVGHPVIEVNLLKADLNDAHAEARTALTTRGTVTCKGWYIELPCCKCCEYTWETETGDCANPHPPHYPSTGGGAGEGSETSPPLYWADAACIYDNGEYGVHFRHDPFWGHTPAKGSIVVVQYKELADICGEHGQALEAPGNLRLKVTNVPAPVQAIYGYAIFGTPA